MIKYLGSKRLFLDQIQDAVFSHFPEAQTFLDLFAGTSRVGHAMKKAGLCVTSNDYLSYAYTLAQCYVEADRQDVEHDATLLLAELQKTPAKGGWFTQNFCEQARFIHPKNGAKIEAIRCAIEKKSLSPDLKSVLLTSLIEAADRVDSTCGVQMAYLKSWAKRAHNDLELRMPDLVEASPHGKGRALLGLAQDHASTKVDVAYLDPPYNQHSYLGNYHLWETLVKFDEPELYGIAQKRVEVRSKKSAFNRKREALEAMKKCVEKLNAKLILVSFSDEGYISKNDMQDLLKTRGEVTTLTRDYKRYVGAQIGQHNLKGERVGKVSHLHNREFLFVVKTPELAERNEKSAQNHGEVRAPSKSKRPVRA